MQKGLWKYWDFSNHRRRGEMLKVKVAQKTFSCPRLTKRFPLNFNTRYCSITPTGSMKKSRFFSNTKEKRYRALKIKISLAGSNNLDIYLFQSYLTLLNRGLEHARLPCPSPTPGACSNSCPSSRWCHPTISSSVVPFSSCPQSFPASGSIQMSWFFASGGQSMGASASASVLPMNIQDWFPLGLISLISLQSKGVSIVFARTTVQKHQFFSSQPFLLVQLSHP